MLLVQHIDLNGTGLSVLTSIGGEFAWAKCKLLTIKNTGKPVPRQFFLISLAGHSLKR